MIEGLKIEIGASDLCAHLVARADHHRERRAFYEQQAEALEDGGLQVDPATNDPVGSLKSSARNHGEREAFFRFMAEHLVAGEKYRLSEQDLIRIEIVSRYL